MVLEGVDDTGATWHGEKQKERTDYKILWLDECLIDLLHAGR